MQVGAINVIVRKKDGNAVKRKKSNDKPDRRSLWDKKDKKRGERGQFDEQKNEEKGKTGFGPKRRTQLQVD